MTEAPATVDDATMSLLEHLEELRSRIIVIAFSIVVGGIIGFLLSEPIIEILRAALPEGQDTLIAISVGESLAVRLRVALYVGLAISVPVILYHLWRFVTPGLTRTERRLIWPMLIASARSSLPSTRPSLSRPRWSASSTPLSSSTAMSASFAWVSWYAASDRPKTCRSRT